MLEQRLVFTSCSSIQFFNLPPSLNTVSEAGSLWQPTTHRSLQRIVQHLCELWDSMPYHWTSSVSHSNPCLGKQRNSLGVASILSMCLCSHTAFISHQKVLLLRFYLYVRDCYGRLYQSLAGFEPTMLLIAFYVIRHLFYPFVHTTL